MTVFRVQVLGTGFLAKIEGVYKEVGFICVRVVQAAAPAEAEKIALEEVRNLDGFKALIAAQRARTTHELLVDEVDDLGESGPEEAFSTGLILFDEHPK